MFAQSKFNGDISRWNVSNVVNMESMFWNNHKFNRDISRWNVKKVRDFSYMFYDTTFNQDISKWNISRNSNTLHMISNCPLTYENMPKY